MKLLVAIADRDGAATAAEFISHNHPVNGHSQVLVLSVVDEPALDKFIANVHGYQTPPELIQRIEKERKTVVDVFCKTLGSDFTDLVIDKEVFRGEVIDGILKKCREWRPDTVLLVHKKRPHHWHHISQDIARLAPCSVVVLQTKHYDSRTDRN